MGDAHKKHQGNSSFHAFWGLNLNVWAQPFDGFRGERFQQSQII